MKELISKTVELQRSSIGEEVGRRIREFSRKKRESNKEWFSELCFCILTANSTAESGLRAQERIGAEGFLSLSEEELFQELKRAGHRFPKVRASFIVGARKHWRIKDILSKFNNPSEAREWLVENVKGIGWKEASHFLRNIGYFDFAILDRHVLGVLCAHGIIKKMPRHLSKKTYVEIEEKMRKLASTVGMKPGELDLYLWFMKTGKVLK